MARIGLTASLFLLLVNHSAYGQLIIESAFSVSNNQLRSYDPITGAHQSTALIAAEGAGMALGQDGLLYVVIRSGSQGQIRKFDPFTLADQGQFSSAYGAGSGDLVFLPGGDILVPHQVPDYIGRIDGTTGANKGVFATSPNLSLPNGFVLGHDGNLLVSSHGNNQILKYDGVTGAYLGVFASGNGLNDPLGIAVGPMGDVFVVNRGTNQVLRFRGVDGAFRGVFASGNGLSNPYDLAFDHLGDLLVNSNIPTPTSFESQVLRFDGSTGIFEGNVLQSNLPYYSLNIAVVPEPSSIVLAGAAIAAVLWRRARVRRSAS